MKAVLSPALLPAQPLCAQVDPEVWFPEKGSRNDQAKSICAWCVLVDPCLEYALARPALSGIWGGATEAERKKMRAEQRRRTRQEVAA